MCINWEPLGPTARATREGQSPPTPGQREPSSPRRPWRTPKSAAPAAALSSEHLARASLGNWLWCAVAAMLEESSPGPSPKGHHTHVTHNTKNESSALLQRILLLSASSRSCAEGPALGASSRVEIQDANCSCSKTSSRRRCLAARAALLQLRARDAMPLTDAFLFKEFLGAPRPIVGNQGAVIRAPILDSTLMTRCEFWLFVE